MQASVVHKKNGKHMWALVENNWTLRRAHEPSRNIDPLEFPMSGLLLELWWGENTFASGPAGLMFLRTLESEAPDSSNHVQLKFPKL